VEKRLRPTNIANAIVYAASQPKHVSINEILVRPLGQGALGAHAVARNRGSMNDRL
jgi:hypothetical protein